jgi:hypothetical protein
MSALNESSTQLLHLTTDDFVSLLLNMEIG